MIEHNYKNFVTLRDRILFLLVSAAKELLYQAHTRKNVVVCSRSVYGGSLTNEITRFAKSKSCGSHSSAGANQPELYAHALILT